MATKNNTLSNEALDDYREARKYLGKVIHCEAPANNTLVQVAITVVTAYLRLREIENEAAKLE